MTYQHSYVSKIIGISTDEVLDQSDHHIDFETI